MQQLLLIVTDFNEIIYADWIQNLKKEKKKTHSSLHKFWTISIHGLIFKPV